MLKVKECWLILNHYNYCRKALQNYVASSFPVSPFLPPFTSVEHVPDSNLGQALLITCATISPDDGARWSRLTQHEAQLIFFSMIDILFVFYFLYINRGEKIFKSLGSGDFYAQQGCIYVIEIYCKNSNTEISFAISNVCFLLWKYFKCNLFLLWQNSISNIVTSVFCVTWSFRNHSNMQIFSRNFLLMLKAVASSIILWN